MSYGNPRPVGTTTLVEPGSRVFRVVYRQMMEVEELVAAPSVAQAKRAINGKGTGSPLDVVGEGPCGPRRFHVVEELSEDEARAYWREERA